MTEVSYEEAAKLLECSPRHARRIIRRSNVKPIRHSYHDVRFERTHILALKRALDERAKQRITVALPMVTLSKGGSRP